MNLANRSLAALLFLPLISIFPVKVFSQPSSGSGQSPYTLDTQPFTSDYSLDWYTYDWSLGDNRSRAGQVNRQNRLSPAGARLLQRGRSPRYKGPNGRQYFSSPSIRGGGIVPNRLRPSRNAPPPKETISGRVIGFQAYPVFRPRGEVVVHDIARLQRADEPATLVDLRRVSRSMKNRLLESNEITALGRTFQLNGRRVFRADRILVNDQIYDYHGSRDRNQNRPWEDGQVAQQNRP